MHGLASGACTARADSLVDFVDLILLFWLLVEQLQSNSSYPKFGFQTGDDGFLSRPHILAGYGSEHTEQCSANNQKKKKFQKKVRKKLFWTVHSLSI